MRAVCRWAHADDVPRVKAFMREGFGADSYQSLAGRFEWLFLQNPRGFHATIGESNDRVVAFRGYLPVVCDPLGDQHAAFGMDFMVFPECRGQGLGRQIIEMAIERFDLVFTLPSPSNERIHQKMGALRLARLFGAVSRRRPPAVLRPSKALVRDWLAFACGRSLASCDGTARYVDVVRACEVVSSLPSRVSASEWGIGRDVTFLRWRYAMGPYAADYRFVELRPRGLPPAIAVVRSVGADGLKVIDLVAAAENRRRSLSLLAGCGLAAVVSSPAAGKTLTRAFTRAGYLVRPADGVIYAITRHNDLLKVIGDRQWFSFAGDSDIDLMRLPSVVETAV